ncbi:hypothetical protein ACNJEK_21245, partial [Mycobacterium tuberculosis]
KGIDEAIEQGTGGKVRGVQDAKNKAEKIKQGTKDAWEAGKPRLPYPEPTPQEKPQNPKPAWPETPVPQMPKVPLLQGYNPQNIPPAIKMPSDLNRPEPAP